MEQNAEIQALEDQIKNFKDQQEQASTKEEYDALQTEIVSAENKLAAKRAEIEQRDKVYEDAQDPYMSYAVNGVDFREHSANEESYQALRIAVELKLQEIEQRHTNELNALKESFNGERAQLKEQLSSAVAAAVAAENQKYDELYEQFDQAKRERDDFEKKLGIAGEEITTLKRENDELRAQVSKPAGPTNLDYSALEEAKRKAHEAKPVIYDKEQLDNKGSKFGAKLAKTGEYIEFGYLEQGKYREVTAEEAARFRAEADAEEAAKPAVPAVESDLAVTHPTAPPIHSEESFLGDTTEQQSYNPAVDGKNVEHGGTEATLEERVAKLEAAVFGWRAVA